LHSPKGVAGPDDRPVRGGDLGRNQRSRALADAAPWLTVWILADLI